MRPTADQRMGFEELIRELSLLFAWVDGVEPIRY
jgi:hypothetical protein